MCSGNWVNFVGLTVQIVQQAASRLSLEVSSVSYVPSITTAQPEGLPFVHLVPRGRQQGDKLDLRHVRPVRLGGITILQAEIAENAQLELSVMSIERPHGAPRSASTVSHCSVPSFNL